MGNDFKQNEYAAEGLRIRKKNRLEGFDYSNACSYFITICVKNLCGLLGAVDVGANCVRPCLSEIGVIVENEITKISQIYENVEIDKYVVMPNHIHMIIMISAKGDGRTQFAPTVSRIVKQFKGVITKRIGVSIWQKSFYDHIVRGESDYRKISRYIDENPSKWEEDCYFIK